MYSQQDSLANGTCWSSSRTIMSGICLFGEVFRHSGLCKNLSCALCCEASRRELFVKILFLLLAFEIALFHSTCQDLYPWLGLEQRPTSNLTALQCYQLRFMTKKRKTSRWTASVFSNNPCINHFLLLSLTREYHPRSAVDLKHEFGGAPKEYLLL